MKQMIISAAVVMMSMVAFAQAPTAAPAPAPAAGAPTMGHVKGTERHGKEAMAIDAACATEGSNYCGNEKVGTGLIKCLKGKEGQAGVTISPACHDELAKAEAKHEAKKGTK
jgi:hypothetical protein